MLTQRLRVFFFLLLVLGWQSLALAQSVEFDAELHEHNCPLCLAADQYESLSLGFVPTVAVLVPNLTACFDISTSYTATFQANFFGRAPPISPFV